MRHRARLPGLLLSTAVAGLVACSIVPAFDVDAPARVLIDRPSRLPSQWEGTWRSARGASGVLRVFIDWAEGNRLGGRLQFEGGTCGRSVEFAGRARDRTLTLEAELGAPCGTATVRIIESAEPQRLVGSYRTSAEESGLFAIYPK
ncbi:MAG: hypothetical protein HYU51_01030 [Candidatus Rokubacteria bacterium]|nr:hypothetical protein [Candidatus Rokubacteria bacterium]